MKKLIIIEDEKDDLNRFKKMLRKWSIIDYEIIHYNKFEDDFTDVDEFIEKDIPQIINIVDINIDDIEAVMLDLVFKIDKNDTELGYKIGRRIREKYFNLPIIIYSQLEANYIVEEGLYSDFDGYIYKFDFGDYTADKFMATLGFAKAKRDTMICNLKENRTQILTYENKYFREINIQEEGKIIFVIMPFSSEIVKPDVYEVGIKEAVDEINEEVGCNYKCIRVDEDLFSTTFMDKIFTYISKSEIVVAVLTGDNPNVYYELGIAHLFNKDVILLKDNFDSFPSDIRNINCHKYKEGHCKELKENMKDILGKYLQI